ncbi:hypothetical protein E1B28_006200 [Marasmius oreades]|uniref:Uncharacterized protein n=1 Tax=Marasmius oreades TaxID=181124 RepID=A0A9P7S540_9AGAR|nr:uncharacterized protein E1B28_006200 [Marasmius oreades]KAG7095460.1 hypothetical protein E1B28_006200 [Marasmius oreades]
MTPKPNTISNSSSSGSPTVPSNNCPQNDLPVKALDASTVTKDAKPDSPTMPKHTNTPLSNPFMERMLRIHQDLIATGLYLGENNVDYNISDRVLWTHDPLAGGNTKTNILVTKDSYNAYTEALEVAEETDDNVTIPALQLAKLSAVVTISDDNFFLNPFAGYTAENWTSDITKAARIKFRAVAPPARNIFSNDFPTVIANVNKITRAAEEKKTIRTGFVETVHGAGHGSMDIQQRLEFRHDLLRSTESHSHTGWLPAINIREEWPDINAVANEKLDMLGSDWYMEPLHVRTKNGEKLLPNKYADLKNAVAKITFSLQHHAMGFGTRGPNDSYAALVDEIDIVKESVTVGLKREHTAGSDSGPSQKKFKV